jgi:diadenosine tetraphosphatase ApaH/serine/threonine PP2A family protein phosphatase
MWAVLSDIHANLEALDAVLADIAKHSVSQIFCLGDLGGYGPNPVECTGRAFEWDVTLLGDHDQHALFEPVGFSLPNELVASALWSQNRLNSHGTERHWEFLAKLPRSHAQGDFLFVHGSPRNPLNEYVFPEDIYNQRKMERVGELLKRYCLAGHTHVPGVFAEPAAAGGQWEYIGIQECFGFYRLDGRKSIVNVGSVGQPRDGDWRACYTLVDGWDVTFRRVEYDVETTVQKIYATPELENFLGDRLREGR